jgi:hypothetical protein
MFADSFLRQLPQLFAIVFFEDHRTDEPGAIEAEFSV